MKFFRSLRHFFHTGKAVSAHALPHWGYCPHCAATTPRRADAWYGEAHCARCGAGVSAGRA